MTHLTPPQPPLAKRGSLTPSVRRLLSRYPPAILEDAQPQQQQQGGLQDGNGREERGLPLTPFDRRFPQGYKVADDSIPLHPDEVPPGYETIFSPTYNPVCRRVPFPPKRVSNVRMRLMIVISMGILVAFVMGCRSRNTSIQTGQFELDNGAKSVLGESTVVEIEYQVWDFMWHCIQCIGVNRYGHHHDRKEHTALTTGKTREWHIGLFGCV